MAVLPETLQVPWTPGISGCVIDTTCPTSLPRPSKVVCHAAVRASRHSAGVTPPTSSRVRVAAIRSAWLSVEHPTECIWVVSGDPARP